MDNKLKESLRLAELEFEKEPMRDLYHKKIIGFPSRLRIKKILLFSHQVTWETGYCFMP